MAPDRLPVVLTRSAEDCAELAALLAARGVPMRIWPALATVPVEPPGGAPAVRTSLRGADWVIFTSRRAVRALAALLQAGDGKGLAASLPCASVAAVGAATAAELTRAGVVPALVGDGSGALQLVPGLVRAAAPGAALLLVRSAAADRDLPSALTRLGFEVRELALHAPVAPAGTSAEEPISAVACASPSAARHALAARPWLQRVAFVAYGETTARALRELHGIARVEVARSPSASDVAAAVFRLLGLPPSAAADRARPEPPDRARIKP